jgi:hypothetical protein
MSKYNTQNSHHAKVVKMSMTTKAVLIAILSILVQVKTRPIETENGQPADVAAPWARLAALRVEERASIQRLTERIARLTEPVELLVILQPLRLASTAVEGQVPQTTESMNGQQHIPGNPQ